MLGATETKSTKQAHITVGSLNPAVVEELAAVDRDMVVSVCSSFRFRLRMVFAAGFGYIKNAVVVYQTVPK